MTATPAGRSARGRGSTASVSGPQVSQGQIESGSHQKRVNRQKTGIGDEILTAMSERDFQKHVVDALRRRGWLVFIVPDMRKTTAGLPDLLCLHAGHTVLLAWELKRESGKPTPIQRAVLALLGGIPGVDARIVKPSTWPALRDGLLDTEARTAGRRQGEGGS